MEATLYQAEEAKIAIATESGHIFQAVFIGAAIFLIDVQKFGQIGKELISRGDNSVKPVDPSSSDPKIIESNLSEQLGSENIGHTFSNTLEAQILSLKQHVKLMEGKLDETRATLEVKESRVAELEDTGNIRKSFKEELGSMVELQNNIESWSFVK